MSESLLGDDPFQNKIRVDQSDRREHMYLLGASGSGKSTLLTSLILQDIKQGLGVLLLEPHGSLIENVLRGMQLLPNPRYDDVIYLDISEPTFVWGMNLFQCSDLNDIFAVENTINQVMTLLKKVYEIDYNTPHMYQFFLNLTQTFIYNPPYGFLDVPRLFSDKTFTLGLAANVPNVQVQWFWKNFFENKSRHQQTEDYNSIVNKLDEFFRPVLKTIFGQQTSTIDLRKIMDERKILFCRLNARWESLTKITGTSLVAALLDAAYSRQNIAQNKRKQFNAYFDEFQWFESQLFAQLFSEARKWGLSCTISHQVLEQIEDPSILATCQQAKTIISYRVSGKNGIDLASSFDSTPEPEETGKRKKQASVHDVVGALLSKGSHENPVVNRFVLGILRELQLRLEKSEPRIWAALNDLLYKEMVGIPTPEFLPDSEYPGISDFFNIRQLFYALGIRDFILVFDKGDKPNVLNNIKVRHDDKKAVKAIREVWIESEGSLLYNLAVQALDTEVKNVIRNIQLIELFKDLDIIEKLRNGKAQKETTHEYMAGSQYSGYQRCIVHDKYEVKQYPDQWKDLLRQGIEIWNSGTLVQIPRENWYPLDIIDMLAWVQEKDEDAWEPVWKLVSGQEFTIANQYGVQLEQRIEQILQPEKKVFLDFFRELKAVCQALRDNPILGDSGEEEITYKKGSHADKQKEIANMLSGLPNYTAYTKVGGNVKYCPTCLVKLKDKDATCPTCGAIPKFNAEFQSCWSCGVKPDPEEIYCTRCGKNLKQEYTISVTPPPMSPTDMKALANKIIQQNFKDAYLKKRSEVEQEIVARQQPPAPLAPQPQKPAAQPPIPAKRKAAIGKICPKCGANNPATSLYCSQDGTKL